MAFVTMAKTRTIYTYCPTRKKGYPSKGRANKAVNKYNAIHKGMGDKMKQFAYKCDCGMWHLTKMEPKEYRKLKTKSK